MSSYYTTIQRRSLSEVETPVILIPHRREKYLLWRLPVMPRNEASALALPIDVDPDLTGSASMQCLINKSLLNRNSHE